MLFKINKHIHFHPTVLQYLLRAELLPDFLQKLRHAMQTTVSPSFSCGAGQALQRRAKAASSGLGWKRRKQVGSSYVSRSVVDSNRHNFQFKKLDSEGEFSADQLPQVAHPELSAHESLLLLDSFLR